MQHTVGTCAAHSCAALSHSLLQPDSQTIITHSQLPEDHHGLRKHTLHVRNTAGHHSPLPTLCVCLPVCIHVWRPQVNLEGCFSGDSLLMSLRQGHISSQFPNKLDYLILSPQSLDYNAHHHAWLFTWAVGLKLFEILW